MDLGANGRIIVTHESREVSLTAAAVVTELCIPHRKGSRLL
jgi:hypothetical protein